MLSFINVNGDLVEYKVLSELGQGGFGATYLVVSQNDEYMVMKTGQVNPAEIDFLRSIGEYFVTFR